MPTSTPTGRIGDGIASVLNGLSLSPRPISIRQRKRPVILDGEALPLLLVCVGDDEEMECLGVSMTPDRMTWLVKRPVAIAMAFAKQGKTADNESMRLWRDAIWGACTLTTLQRTIPELNDVSPRGKAIFDPGAFAGTQVDWGMIELSVETLESKSM